MCLLYFLIRHVLEARQKLKKKSSWLLGRTESKKNCYSCFLAFKNMLRRCWTKEENLVPTRTNLANDHDLNFSLSHCHPFID